MDRKLATKIRRLLVRGRYYATAHALEEMEDDAVFDSDIVAAAETMNTLRIQRDAVQSTSSADSAAIGGSASCVASRRVAS